MPAINRKARSLRGKISQKPIAAGPSDNVDAIELSMKHPFKISQCDSIASRETFKNHARKSRLIARFIRDRLMTVSNDLFVNARRHIAGEEQRLGIDVDR